MEYQAPSFVPGGQDRCHPALGLKGGIHTSSLQARVVEKQGWLCLMCTALAMLFDSNPFVHDVSTQEDWNLHKEPSRYMKSTSPLVAVPSFEHVSPDGHACAESVLEKRDSTHSETSNDRPRATACNIPRKPKVPSKLCCTLQLPVETCTCGN